ncbi:hypothetical protein HHK36_025878 [Tetracentron sinense]|uniref:D-isomer specific 2-hydroxyacid dehydrogenase catalytic domain-containing protein n=1 Tax=Tetracentron sinense TaxID=13715 RepID=A0A834YJL5_TETSI|nr:hypothetical protein HHK36_025878 [Tetracentron sinense]
MSQQPPNSNRGHGRGRAQYSNRSHGYNNTRGGRGCEQHKEGELWIFPKQKDFLKENSNSIRAIVGNATAGADAEMINSLPKLEIISSYSVGLDKIDLPRCKEKGIRVTNTPDVLTEDVADLAIGLILATLRGKMRNKVKFSTGLDTFTLMEQKIGEKLVSFMENDYGGWASCWVVPVSLDSGGTSSGRAQWRGDWSTYGTTVDVEMVGELG